MNKINLSQEQAEVVNLEEGSYLVLASAGSGKTRVLTERIKRLSELGRGKILAITFTNKAATEIKERLGSVEEIHRNVFVGTFHSFCQSILELRFKLLGYSVMPHLFEDDTDRIELIKQAINSVPFFQEIYDNLEAKKKHEYTYNALQFISTVKRELILVDEFAEKSENKEYQYLYETYQDILRSNNAIDFDDIIRLVYELLSNNEAVANLYRKAYSFICIDECQDLNKLQYLFLRALCGNTIKNVMMVGDPNQSIYGFNGSTPSFMKNDFIVDFKASEIELKKNYRCSKTIIDASNRLMGLDIKMVNNYAITGKFLIEESKSEEAEALFIVNKISELISMKFHEDIEGELTYSKISILARNKFVFKSVEEQLKLTSIPYFYKSGNPGIKFSSDAMKIFDLCFRVEINPSDKLHQDKLEDFLKVRNSFDSSKSRFPIFSKIKEIIEDITIDNLHLKIDDLEQWFKNEGLFDEDEKKLTLYELNDFANQLTLYKKQNLSPTLSGFKSAFALGLTNNFSDKEVGVCLSTVHTMKGQESEIVFLIGMDDGTFPDFRAINKGEKELQQEKNNAYVAFTRAKRFLYVSYPRERLMPWGGYSSRKISRFLEPLKCEFGMCH